MQTVILDAQKREKTGKEHCKKIRREGMVPAILYGRGMEPVNLAVNSKEVRKALNTEGGANVIVTLKVTGNGADAYTAMIHEIQRDSISQNYNHVDFQAISLTEKVTAIVKIRSHGTSPAEKTGGNVDHVLHEVEVECLPLAIPGHFDIDISALEIGDAIHVGDIKVPEGVEIVNDADDVVVVVHAPQAEEAAATVEGTPEVIAKGKAEE